MNRRKFLRNMMASGVALATFRLTAQGQVLAQSKKNPLKRKVTPADRKAAALNARVAGLKPGVVAPHTTAPSAGGTPDYFGPFPNYANSPFRVPVIDPATGQQVIDANGQPVFTKGIRKFVDSLPGFGPTNASTLLGKYIPVAVPDTTTYSGADYYEIGLVDFDEYFHRDLGPTRIRGYVQLNDPSKPAARYLGPVIVAQRNRPVRVKFTNMLSTGAGGDLFLPVDETVMGAGMGPNGGSYTQNRATLHLHGGNTPWISDGTPHQWTTPANENTPYPKGVTVQNVPDMPAAGPGELTFFYTNQQSARLMFYHDHAYGITRLNVYAGEAAGYLLEDPDEQALVSSGVIPAEQIPLLIQDKTFIDADTISSQDPTWKFTVDAARNDLWFPHVYMPNQNPYDISGANAMGRWDYGPWFWPPFTGITNGLVPNPYYDPNNAPWEPPEIPGTPNPSIVPEAFMDTPVVNGLAYPYLKVDPKAYRFRILNACNDRTLNLQLYTAKSTGDVWSGATLVNVDAGEVNMLPAVPGYNWPKGWPTPDGRDGGFPDPAASGPNMIQIGTEGGLLPNPAVIPNMPIGYDYNRRSVTVLNVLQKALFLGPAERADVIVDFSAFAGKTLILYNDAPAPVPAFDPRYDYYTDDPDQTATGGAPTTPAGYGPNTRTIMQIQVANTTPAPAFSLSNLQNALPLTFAASQDKIIVPNAVYNKAYGATALPADSYARIQNTSMNIYNGKVSAINLITLGGGYTAVPSVTFTGGYGTGTSATAVLAPAAAGSISLVNGGAGYTAVPTATISGGSGSGAQVSVKIAGILAGFTIANGGKGYKSAPTVILTGGNPSTPATVTATIKSGVVTGFNISNPGAGYSSAPTVTLSGGNPTTVATATARISATVTGLTLTNGGANYTGPLTVTFSGGTPTTPATATAQLAPTGLASITVLNGGGGYLTAPTVTITPVDGKGSGATATALIVNTGLNVGLQPKAIQELFDPEYGRMNAILGCEVPNTTGVNQTTIPYYYIDPPNEIIKDSDPMQPIGSTGDGTQIWKITHNGVDTHAIHFHLFNVQLINRVGWDGAIQPPETNEQGWKETVRMNPLEDCIVALRPYKQDLPFDLPNSIHLMDVTKPAGSTLGFTNVDPSGRPAAVTNDVVNFGYEYVWHCHLLGHEENDMMRPMIFAVTPKAPTGLTATATRTGISLSWTSNATNATGFTVQRSTSTSGPWTSLALQTKVSVASTTGVTTVTGSDTSIAKKTTYVYRVVANNVVGYTKVAGYPNMSMDSTPSNTVTVTSL
ncbi:MAG TPA: hypothetical protein VH186_13120 [Chloroflexia bacterium]|nr:hypothetical protein [Chloroflexia bacterium]